MFEFSALRYSIKNAVHHMLASIPVQAYAQSQITLDPPFQAVMDTIPQLWSLLLLSLPLLHARALIDALSSAVSEYSTALELVRSSKLPTSFKGRFEALSATLTHVVASASEQPQKTTPTQKLPALQKPFLQSSASTDFKALADFQRFLRFYYAQISECPEKVVQWSLTFPQGTSIFFSVVKFYLVFLIFLVPTFLLLL
jgi:hypothetical protein